MSTPSVAFLRGSLTYWQGAERWAKKRHTAATKAGNRKLQKKWSARLKKTRSMVAQRTRELARLARKVRHPSARAAAVAYGVRHAGKTVEHPAGSNRGGIISTWQRQLLGADGYPWCGCLAAACLRAAGVKGIGSWMAGVAAIEDQARAGRGCFQRWTTSTKGVRRGDLVVLFGRGVHVEVVRYVKGGVVYTVGGNTSPGDGGSQANGGGVYLRARPLSQVHGFAIVDYPN